MPEIATLARSRLGLGALLLCYFLSTCSTVDEYDTNRINAVLIDSLINSTESWNIELSIIEDDHRIVRINAPYATTTQTDTGSVTLIGGNVYIQVFDTNFTLTRQIWSKHLQYQSHKNYFEFIDSVRILTLDNKRLTTDFLIWNQATSRISTASFTVITTPTDSIAGYGLLANDDLSEYIIKDVTGTVSIEE